MYQAKIKTWVEELETLTEKYSKLTEGLSMDELNTKPNAERWSIAQVVDHIIKTGESYHSIFEQVEEGTFKVPFSGNFGFLVKLFGNMILKGVEPSRKRKVKTFPVWEPTSSNVGPDLMERFQKEQQYLIDYISKSEPFLEKKQVICSPANSKIVYYLETVFDIIITHEERHLNQAREVLEACRF